MINLRDDYVIEVVNKGTEELSKDNVKIITLDSYLENYLSECSSKKEITFPYTINVPRDLDYMLRTGDFSPSHKIVIEKPIMYGSSPIWTRSSMKGVSLGFGYENCNKKELSDIYLGDVSSVSGPHAHIAGKSGGGKSVAISNIIFNMLFAYSPYEINLHLIDAKIGEAARYGNHPLMSHIKTIGATADIGYVISITEYMTRKAEKLNQLFAKVGVNNLGDFRSETGLHIPRDITFVDEYQLQYQKSTASEADKLTKNYDMMCTAGRSTGTHLALCTQSFLPELKQKLFKNIEVRACLTCEPITSENVLGNKVASDCKNIGEMYVNLSADQSVASTRMFRVPFQSKADFDKHRIFLAEVCDNYNMDKTLNFFNETVLMKEDGLTDLIDKYSSHKRLVMGNPATLKSKEIDVYYNQQSFGDIENLLFFSPKSSDVKEYLTAMVMNYKSLPISKNEFYFLCADRNLEESLDVPDYMNVKSIRKYNDDAGMFLYLRGMVYRKSAMLEADSEIFRSNVPIDAQVKREADDIFASNPGILTELNYKRLSLYIKKLSSTSYLKMYNLNNLSGDKLVTSLMNHAALTLQDLLQYSSEFLHVRATAENLPVTYINILGIDKIEGLTRGNSFANEDAFKTLMFDAPYGNVCFVCFTTNVMDMSPYNKTFKYIISSNSKTQEGKLGLELPKEMQPLLGYAYNPNTGDSVRFKRLHIESDYSEGLI